MRIDVQIRTPKTWYKASFMNSWSDRLIVPGVSMLLETFNKSPASLIKCRVLGVTEAEYAALGSWNRKVSDKW